MSALALVAAVGCRPRDRDYDARAPREVPEGRPSGCVDTPFLGPDAYNAARGVECSSSGRDAAVDMLRGKVVAEEIAGLPGRGLEGMLVSIHPAIGTPIPSHLPETLAEVTTDAQGAFVLSAVLGDGDYFVAVRAREGESALTIQRVSLGESSALELLLLVPLDPALRHEPAPTSPGAVPPPSTPEGPAPPAPVIPR